jgi:hypothetical protein
MFTVNHEDKNVAPLESNKDTAMVKRNFTFRSRRIRKKTNFQTKRKTIFLDKLLKNFARISRTRKLKMPISKKMSRKV